MSIQAVAWALEQSAIPARPKLVLVSIANHADHRTGYCYLRADTIADEAACSVRGVHNFIGDLVRNGFIRRVHKRGEDGKQRANDYWIIFDRSPDTKWIGDRSADVPDEATISGEPDAPGALGENENETPPEAPLDEHGAPGPDAHACTRKSLEEPSKTNPEKKAGAHSFAAPPRSYKAPPIAPEAPQGALHPDASKPIFVFKGTRAWDAWVRHKERERRVAWTLTTTLTINGERRTGWHFPTLFPPGVRMESESSDEGSGSDPPVKKTA